MLGAPIEIVLGDLTAVERVHKLLFALGDRLVQFLLRFAELLLRFRFRNVAFCLADGFLRSFNGFLQIFEIFVEILIFISVFVAEILHIVGLPESFQTPLWREVVHIVEIDVFDVYLDLSFFHLFGQHIFDELRTIRSKIV